MGAFFGLGREGTPLSILKHRNAPFWACFDVRPPFSSSLITSPSLSVPLPDFFPHLDSFLLRYSCGFLWSPVESCEFLWTESTGVQWILRDSCGFLVIPVDS